LTTDNTDKGGESGIDPRHPGNPWFKGLKRASLERNDGPRFFVVSAGAMF